METLTTKTEITNEFEEIEVFYASKEENGRPKTGNGDVIIDPNKNNEPIPEGKEEGEGEDRPTKTLKI